MELSQNTDKHHTFLWYSKKWWCFSIGRPALANSEVPSKGSRNTFLVIHFLAPGPPWELCSALFLSRHLTIVWGLITPYNFVEGQTRDVGYEIYNALLATLYLPLRIVVNWLEYLRARQSFHQNRIEQSATDIRHRCFISRLSWQKSGDLTQWTAFSSSSNIVVSWISGSVDISKSSSW